MASLSFKAKPLIQLVLPEYRDWRGARFVPSADTVPNWGRIGGMCKKWSRPEFVSDSGCTPPVHGMHWEVP